MDDCDRVMTRSHIDTVAFYNDQPKSLLYEQAEERECGTREYRNRPVIPHLSAVIAIMTQSGRKHRRLVYRGWGGIKCIQY